jgi:hypothetical protein
MPSILKALADNQLLFDEVKRVILAQFTDPPYAEGTSDELLGQMTRARIVGRKKVEDAFREIAKHKSTPDQPERKNEAR